MVHKITIFLLVATVLIVGYSAMPTGKVKLQNKLQSPNENTNSNRVKRETVDKLKALDKNNKLKGGNYYGSYYNSYYDSYYYDSYYDSYYYDSYYYDSYYKK